MNSEGELVPVTDASGRRMSQLLVGQTGEERDTAAELGHQRLG